MEKGKKYEVIQMLTSELVPYDKNPRYNDTGVEAVANSIREFGFQQPIVVDKDHVIIVGHTRLKAAELLGLERVPVIVADLTEQQARAYRIADNKTGDKSTWNVDLLGEELNQLVNDFDMTDFGFGEFEITMLTEDMGVEGYDDDLINQYTQNSEEFLKAKRIIITYKDDKEEAWLKKLLNEDDLKVAYSVEELMRP